MNSGCFKKKRKYKVIEPPVSYKSTSFGLRAKTFTKLDKDSVRILSRPYVSQRLDLIYSIIEVYDKNDSLLHRTIQSATDTNEVIQDYWLYPITVDTFIIRTWGFGYMIDKDEESSRDRKKLFIGTTPLEEIRIPFEVSKREKVQMDFMKSSQK
jgi:hypothetical protein